MEYVQRINIIDLVSFVGTVYILFLYDKKTYYLHYSIMNDSLLKIFLYLIHKLYMKKKDGNQYTSNYQIHSFSGTLFIHLSNEFNPILLIKNMEKLPSELILSPSLSWPRQANTLLLGFLSGNIGLIIVSSFWTLNMLYDIRASALQYIRLILDRY